MRLIFLFYLLSVYLIASINAENDDDENNNSNTNDVPIFIHSRFKDFDKNKDFEYPISSFYTSKEFLNDLRKIFPHHHNQANQHQKRIAVFLIDRLKRANAYKIKHQVDSTELAQDTIFYPAVDSGYTELIDYLNRHQDEFKVKLIEKNSIEEALDEYKKSKMKFYDGVVFVRLDDPENDKHHLSRHVRSNSGYSFGTTNNDTYLFGEQCAILFNSIYIRNSTVSSAPPVYTQLALDATNSDFVCCKNCSDNTTATLTLKFSKGVTEEYITSATLIFSRGNLYWKMLFPNSTIQTNVRTLSLKYMDLPYNFETPFKFSYACPESRFKLIDPAKPREFKQRVEFYFGTLQFQPFDIKTNGSSYTFGQVSYCNGFFTNGIWMGVITTLIVAFVVAIGVYLMVNVNTMDRFDDPKGKQLTIAAEK